MIESCFFVIMNLDAKASFEYLGDLTTMSVWINGLDNAMKFSTSQDARDFLEKYDPPLPLELAYRVEIVKVLSIKRK